jgi:hypothetical protein
MAGFYTIGYGPVVSASPEGRTDPTFGFAEGGQLGEL